MTNRADLPAVWTEALDVLAEKIGLPMIRVSAGRSADGRTVRDYTPKVDLSIRAIRAAVPADKLDAVGDTMIAIASRLVSERIGTSAETIRAEIEEDAAATPVKSTTPVRRILCSISEITNLRRDHHEGEIDALIVFLDVLAGGVA